MKKSLILFLIIMLWGCEGEQQSHSKNPLDEAFIPETIKGEEGYFRVGKTKAGQWWFITPDDQPFFYKGVCAVNRAGTAGGRRAKDGTYSVVIDEKYGYQATPDTFVLAQFDRLENWGFNALGAWTTEEFFERGMPYTEIIEFFKEGPILELPGKTHDMPDIFDPAWKQAINSKARTLCATKRSSKDLIGYFTDNEIGFGSSEDTGFDLGFVNSGRFSYSLLRSFLGLDEGVAARDTAWAFIRKRYPDLPALSEAWGLRITSESDIKQLNDAKVPLKTATYQTDAKAFQLYYAEHYFRITYETIKRYDPNHLVLGCRFGAPPEEDILKVMKPWVDVVSMNNYRPVLYQRIDYVYQQTDLPIIIGEFSCNPDLFKYVPLPNEPEGGYSLLERVQRRGEEVLLRASTHPALIGYTWYRWVANTTKEDNFSFGLVNREDELEVHVPFIKEVHPKLESVRREVAKQGDAFFQQTTGSLVLRLEDKLSQLEHVINFEVQDGKISPQAFGWQMNAQDVEGQLGKQGGSIEMVLTFEEWHYRGKKIQGTTVGTFSLELERDGQYIKGKFTGEHEGQPMEGKVSGYFLPNLPEMPEAS